MIKNIFINIIFHALIIMHFQQVYSLNNENYSVANNYSFIVRKIHIIGKTKYDNHFISKLSEIYPEESVDVYGIKMDDAVKKLWNSHLFKKINIYKKNVDRNVIDLFFELEDIEEIHDIQIKGIDKDQFSTIKKIKVGDKISGDLIQTVKNDIREYYIKKGYYEIDVKSEINNNYNKGKNKNVLYLYVNKGKKIEIEEILFHGNRIIQDKELLELMIHTKKNFYPIISIIQKPLLVKENIKEDLKNIINKYKSMGFIDVQVFINSIWKKKSGNYGIKIEIIEGKKYYLGNINILGNKNLKTDFLKKILLYKKGDTYNKIEIERNILNPSYNSILYAYLNLGHLFVHIDLIEKRILNDKIDLEIKIEENKPAYINKVIILGNSITKDRVIRRELKTYPGDIFSINKIKHSLLRLENLNLFEKVYHEIKPNKENGLIDIEWHVVEKNTNEFQFHGGFGGKGFRNVIGNFKLNIGNFSFLNIFDWNLWNPIPQGDGQKLIVYSQLGKDFTSYGSSFVEPWVERNNPTSLTLKSQYSMRKIKNEEYLYFIPDKISHEDNKFLERIDISVEINKFLTFLDPYSKILTSIDYEKFIYQKGIFSKEKKYRFNNLNFLISLQRISVEPNLIFPLKGSEMQLNGIFTLPYSVFFKKNVNQEWMEYFKLKTIFYCYKKIMDNVIFKIGGEFGYLGQYNHTKELFPFQKFYMGGGHNNLLGSKLYDKDHIPLRGYSIKHTIPSNGGTIYDKLILEIRYLIKNLSNLKIWTICFMEGGNINDSYEKFNPLMMNKSIGFGFRLFWTPIGVLGIDFGRPIDHSEWKTHFIVGKDL